MSLILVGQSELWERFQLQVYVAIRQRIDLQCKLPMDRAQVGDYIKKHLTYARAGQDIFSDSAIDEIFSVFQWNGQIGKQGLYAFLDQWIPKPKRIIDDHMVKLEGEG